MKATVSIQKLLRRLCAALCSFALLFALLPVTPARAASSAESAAAILLITNDTDEAYYPAVVLKLDEVYCFSTYPKKLQETSQTSVVSAIGEVSHPVTAKSYVEQLNLVFWTVDDAFENDIVSPPNGSASVEGETCSLLYINSDTAKLDIAQDVTLGEFSNENYNLIQISGISTSNVHYPAALIDENECVVGIAISANQAYVLSYTASSSSPSGSSSSSSSSNQPRPRTNSDNKTSVEPLYLVVGIAVIAIIAVLFLKKKKGSTSSKAINNTNTRIDITPDDNKTAFFPTDNVTAPIPPQQTLWLAATSGYMMGRVYPMENNEITIGRSPTASVPYEDNSVSKQHCKLYKNASGQWMLMDCNSRNGTYMERIGKLSPMQPVEIYPGDTFYLGSKKHGFTIKNN